MSYVLAVDVGTTFTAAAISTPDRNQPSPPETLPLGLHGAAVPSVLWYGEDGRVLFGEAAERRGIDDPTRVVREFKRRIGDAVPIAVGERSVSPEEMFATMVAWVVARAEEREGAAPSAVTVTHPAGWGGYRAQLIREALSAAGLPGVTLLSEPEAAALHYAAQERVADGSTIAVYDLGGGTFDTAILRKSAGGRFDFLGQPQGIGDLGGADFDALVFRHVADHAGDGLLGLDPYTSPALQALSLLKRECTEAKEALSSDTEATIQVLLPGIQEQVRLVRSEFEEMIAAPVHDSLEVLGRCLEAAGLEPQDLSAVLLIGGSSRIPLIAQLISEKLGRPIAVDADPKSSICLGAALAGATALQDAPVQAVTIQPQPAPEKLQRHSVPVTGREVPDPAIPIAATGGSQKPPRGRKRLTAISLAAILLTSVTATAAQGPEVLGELSAIFGPEGDKQDSPGSDVGGTVPGSPLSKTQGNSPNSGAGQGTGAAADVGSWTPVATYPGSKGTERYGSGSGNGSPGQNGGTDQQSTGQGSAGEKVTAAPKGGSVVTADPVPTGSAAVSGPTAGPVPTQEPGPTQAPAVPTPDPADPSPDPTPTLPADPLPDPEPGPTLEPGAEPTLSPGPTPDPAAPPAA